jgi:hypothetical protein
MNEITSAAMQKLLGISRVALNALADREIAVRGVKKGTSTAAAIAVERVDRADDSHASCARARSRRWHLQ